MEKTVKQVPSFRKEAQPLSARDTENTALDGAIALASREQCLRMNCLGGACPHTRHRLSGIFFKELPQSLGGAMIISKSYYAVFTNLIQTDKRLYFIAYRTISFR